MNKRILAVALSIAFTLPVHAQNTVSEKAREIHNSAIVVDTHADTPQRFLDENFDIGSTDPKDQGHISLDKARAGNLGAEFFSIWVEPETNQGHSATTNSPRFSGLKVDTPSKTTSACCGISTASASAT